MTRFSSKKAFTLIELLVVIAIIAILAAILFPVFAQAKVAAQKTTDLSNQRQLATAVLIYNGDNNDFFPRGTYYLPNPNGGDDIRVTWRESVYPYVRSGNTGVDFLVAQEGLFRAVGSPSNSFGSYGAHGNLMPFSDLPAADALPSRSQSQIGNVSGKFMITQQGINPDWGPGGSAADEMFDIWWFWGGENWPPQFEGPNSGAFVHEGDVPLTVSFGAMMPRYRFDGTNAAFADGSARFIRQGSFNWCRFARIPELGIQANGEDISWMGLPGEPCAQWPD